MNSIKIAERLHPFSHEKGCIFLLPRTSLSIRVFPTRFFIADLEDSSSVVLVEFDWTGPVKEFTVQLDLERGFLSVFGQAVEGYVRYKIGLEGGSLWFNLDRAPKEGISVSSSLFPSRRMYKQERVKLVESPTIYEGLFIKERLSLGNHKAQDLCEMRKRLDPRELFPHWLRLAQQLPVTSIPQQRGWNYRLLDHCIALVKDNKKQEILSALMTFFLASFSCGFVPGLVDTQYQGLIKQEPLTNPLPSGLPLLKESAECIRSLFYQEIQPGEIALLPCLPPELHCGRMIEIQTTTGQILHIEWTKKALRKVFIESFSSDKLTVWLPKGISSCRLTSKRDNLKKIEVPKGGPLVLSLESGLKVALDRFEG